MNARTKRAYGANRNGGIMHGRIEIVTRIDARMNAAGTYRDDVGRVGPRNLLLAARALPEHRRHMTACNGNIGHAGSWIEVGGIRLDRFDEETAADSVAAARNVIAAISNPRQRRTSKQG